LDSTLSDAASTLSGLASSTPDGVTVMADAGEVVAVAAAATMLGVEVVKQIQQSRDQRQWERLVALGQAIESTEERSRHMTERLVKVEDAFAAREGQASADSDRASAPPRPSGPSSSEAAATSRLETQTEGVNDLNERVSALGQPRPKAERLRAPKLDSQAPIGQRLDALEAYLSKIHQTLDHIEERLAGLEKDVGLAAPGQDVAAERAGPRAQNGVSSPSRSGQPGDQRVRPKRQRTLSQMQA
jgi:primosomal protein N''